MKKDILHIISAMLTVFSCTLEKDESVLDGTSESYYTIEVSEESKSDIYETSAETSVDNTVYAVYYRGILVGGGVVGQEIKLNDGFRYNLYLLSSSIAASRIPSSEEALVNAELPLSPDGTIPKVASLTGLTPAQMDAYDGSRDSKIRLSLTRIMAKALVRVNLENSIRDYYDEISINEIRVVNGASTYCPFNPEERTLSNTRSGVWDSASSPSSGTYYMLYMPENLQGDLLPESTSAADKSQEGLLDNGIDPTHCTYVETSISFYSSAGTGLDITYRFYPGGNNTCNFDIKRNRTYNITLSLTADGFDITGTWKSELDDQYDNRYLYFSLPDGTVPSSWEFFDNRTSSNPFEIAINFSRDGSGNETGCLNQTTFPYGYRLYVDGQLWTNSMVTAPGSSALSISVDESSGTISIYNGGSAVAGQSVRLRVETVDGQLYDEVSVLLRRYSTFGYGIIGGAIPTAMYLGQYSRLAITLGSEWKSDFSTTDINSLTLQIRNYYGTSAVSNKFYFKNTIRDDAEGIISVSVVSDAVYNGTLWIGNSTAGIWKKVTDLRSQRPNVVYSFLPGEYPTNLADGNDSSDIWTYVDTDPDAEACVFYVTYTDAAGRRLCGPGTCFDNDGYEGNLCVDDYIDITFPRSVEPVVDVYNGGPEAAYDACVVVSYIPDSGTDWMEIHQLDLDPELSFADVSMSNASGNSLNVGLKVYPIVITLANSYVKTAAYSSPDSDWYLKALVDNCSGVPFSMEFNIYSRWEVSDYVKPSGSAPPYFDPPQYVYIDSYTLTRESYYASGIYLMKVQGHALFSQSKTWNESTLEFFNGSTTSNGFTGTLLQFMNREYLNSGNYYVTYPAYNPTNGRFIGNTRTTPTYKDCDFEVRISGSAAYDDYFTVVSNLMEPTWPIVYGSDYYNLKHIYAYVGDMSISVQ